MKPSRRTFVLGSTAGIVAVSARRASADANSTVVLALMGANNRGSQLATGFSKLKGVEFAYVCDPDERAISKGIEAATSGGGRRPQGLKDFRKALDDPAVDGLVCAAPNHWHAAATILACAAGKHVYVEKPCSQTPEEGERMIAAAQRASRVVQVTVFMSTHEPESNARRNRPHTEDVTWASFVTNVGSTLQVFVATLSF
jgi:hypothetical protein